MRYAREAARIWHILITKFDNFMSNSKAENIDGKSSVSHRNEEISKRLSRAMETLSQDARELYVTDAVPRLKNAPTPLEFHREYVSKNIPVIVENSISHWPALRNWNDEDLIEKLGDSQVSVAVTPTGLADAPVKNAFVMPDEESLTMKEFLGKLNQSRDDEDNSIYYIQKQNSNFLSEFETLREDADLEISWAAEAFNKTPDAVNFWMGDERSVTSMHKDHYENIYAVVKGEKIFTLLPPTDLCHVPHRFYPPAKYERIKSTSNYEIVYCAGREVPWISLDPREPILHGTDVKPIICHVKAGDILYLPSLWFHHVQQTEKTIAVNYWYDMEYDIKFCYFQFLNSIKACTEF